MKEGKQFERFRDPIHGFIEVTPLELKIIDSAPFQRLRGIHQLALTHLIYHGAEHSRFGHSLGVMHLASRVFDTVIAKNPKIFSDAQREWYRQILRLIALTHDLGHPPFSHASESILAIGLEHEDFTEKIIKETEIADYINEIGQTLAANYGSDDYAISPELISDIYLGRSGDNPHFIFLRKFMDSELDCDKMDYLLRDSYYCGVKYGSFDLERLIGSIDIYERESQLWLAVDKGGIHAVEEFILARYFMFVQVYFHRARRLYDKMLTWFLQEELPDKRYPSDVHEYLKWDDARVWGLIKEKESSNEWADRIINRRLFSVVDESSTHSGYEESRISNIILSDLRREIGRESIIVDSADKAPHKIPSRHDIDDEKAIPVIVPYSQYPVSLSDESGIINNITKPINIIRIYAKEEYFDKAKAICEQRRKDMIGTSEED
ncbi:HD domain-containing protein [Desulfitobacterium sp.]|uniref:HD domain-containing protein n=1 Tax=Desulfitobacterium sp. TaxID=49981 RepID=UPI002CE56C1E|nr:HD domain-containing protein [Desulfitobacterium sp.]HVJ50597.1 HD domain-containing protein [Desulfitobacterium sp.]